MTVPGGEGGRVGVKRYGLAGDVFDGSGAGARPLPLIGGGHKLCIGWPRAIAAPGPSFLVNKPVA